MNNIEIFSFILTLGEFIGILGIIVAIVGIIIGVIVAILRTILPRINDRREIIKKSYRVIWKKSSELQPSDIFGSDLYRFNENIPYYYRDIDKATKKKISNEQNIIIIGKLIAGKTNLIYQNLKELKKEYYVLIPKDGIELDNIIIPKLRFSKLKRKVIVLDNLPDFFKRGIHDEREVKVKNFISELDKKKIKVIASCKTGREWKILNKKIDIYSIVKEENIVNIPKLEKVKAEKIVKDEWKQPTFPKSYDGNTIGSLIIPLAEMYNKYESVKKNEKNILIALKMLYCTGIYNKRGLFLKNRVRTVCNTGKLSVFKSKFKEDLDSLEVKGFIEIESDNEVRAKDVYLEKIIKSKHKDVFEIFNIIISIFRKDPEALFMCGDRAYDAGLADIERSNYLEISIRSYIKALKVFTQKKFPIDHATTQNNLGNTFLTLSEVRDKEKNCLKAIDAFKKALKVRTLEKLPIDYANTQNNLGNAFGILAGVKDKEKNCIKGIDAYKKTIKVFTQKKFPIEHATTQNNLGNTYLTLAGVKDKEKNCIKGIVAYKKALKIKTLKKFPIDNATTQNNLGNTYLTLAGVKDKEKNCIKGIDAFKKALKVRTLEKLPMDCANTQNNLGNAYGILAYIKDKEKNCLKAIDEYKKALKVCNQKKFPIVYTTTQNNLGTVYVTLAGVKDKEKNCIKAIDAFKKALKVRTLEKLPIDYANTQNNLGDAHVTLARVKDKEKNCLKAIGEYKKALKVRTLEKLPIDYANTQNNLGTAYRALVEVKNIEKNCLKAIDAFKEALKVYTLQKFPIDYADTQNNLGSVYLIISVAKNKEANCLKAIEAFEEALKVYTLRYYPLKNKGLIEVIEEIKNMI